MKSILVSLLALVATSAFADSYTEDFGTDPYASWQTRWFGTNTNARSYYGDPNQDPGDFLWIAEGSDNSGPLLEITFAPAFGSTVTFIAFDLNAYAKQNVTFYDFSGNAFGTSTADGQTHLNAIGIQGLSKIVFDSTPWSSAQVEGNTAIDNISVATQPVPEPASVAALAVGAVAMIRRRKRA